MPGVWSFEQRRKAKERSFRFHNQPVLERPERFSKLRRVRVEKQIPQAQLATAANVALSTYREVELGYTRRPHSATVSRIARALDVPVAEIA